MNDGESPYTIPVVLIVLGAILGGLSLVLADNGNDALSSIFFAIGSLFGFIGATAVAVLLGTSPLRK